MKSKCADCTGEYHIKENLQFDMPKIQLPSFPDRDFIITDYGAIGNGIHMNTESIASAIDDCASSGGGRVVIPPGIWLTGPITLRSNINLHVEPGAFVVFSKNFDDYPLIVTNYEGLETVRCTSPINGKNLENIAITGQGIFDGSGEAWRPVKKSKMTEGQWNKLVNSGGVVNEESMIWWPTAQALKGERFYKDHGNKILDVEKCKPYRDFARPTLLSLTECKNVLLDGPTFQNSPAWCLHPMLCEHVTIRNITVRNPWFSQNGDGLDLDSCKNVVVYNSDFDVGDDAICMKSGKDEDGRQRGIPCENVIIHGCNVYHGHGGFVVGSEMSGGVRNIHVSDCTFMGTDVGLRFKSCRGRGGVVENIYIDNIRMKDIPEEAIIFTTHYGHHKKTPEREQDMLPVTEETPEFRNISIKDTICIDVGKAIHISGLPEMPLNNIHFENLYLTAQKGIECIESKGLRFDNIKLRADQTPVISFYNTHDVELKEVENLDDDELSMDIAGSRSENIKTIDTE